MWSLFKTGSLSTESPTSQADATRPLSTVSFDAGINASSAWTGAREESSIPGDIDELTGTEAASDEEQGDDSPPRPARALFDFEGKPEYREL